MGGAAGHRGRPHHGGGRAGPRDDDDGVPGWHGSRSRRPPRRDRADLGAPGVHGDSHPARAPRRPARAGGGRRCPLHHRTDRRHRLHDARGPHRAGGDRSRDPLSRLVPDPRAVLSRGGRPGRRGGPGRRRRPDPRRRAHLRRGAGPGRVGRGVPRCPDRPGAGLARDDPRPGERGAGRARVGPGAGHGHAARRAQPADRLATGPRGRAAAGRREHGASVRAAVPRAPRRQARAGRRGRPGAQPAPARARNLAVDGGRGGGTARRCPHPATPPRSGRDLVSDAGRRGAASAGARAAGADVPVAEVAAELGYSETATFSRSFRRWEGVQPSRRRGRSS